MTEQDITHEMYVEDMIDGYNEILDELKNTETTKELKQKITAVNDYLKTNEDFFGKGTVFISPALLENIEVIKGIEKIFSNQEEDKKFRKRQVKIDFAYFVAGAVVGFILNIAASSIIG